MIDKESPYLQHYLRTLTDAIISGDAEAIDDWFSHEDMSDANEEFRKILFFHLKLHQPNLFTQHVQYAENDRANNPKAYYQALREDSGVKLRELAVLKHFQLKEQLNFISAMLMTHIDSWHIEALNFEAGNFSHVHLLKQHTVAPTLMTKLLFQENFEALEILAEKTQINSLAFKFSSITVFSDFLHDIAPFKNMSFFWLDNEEFVPEDTFMLHYSQNKEQWFKKQGFSIADKEKLENFKEFIMQAVCENEPENYQYYWLQAFRAYEVKLAFDKLNQTIEAKFESQDSATMADHYATPKLKI